MAKKGLKFNNYSKETKEEILKKIPSLPQGTTREKVIFINMHKNDYSLDNMCEALEISKRTYYKYRAAEDKD